MGDTSTFYICAYVQGGKKSLSVAIIDEFFGFDGIGQKEFFFCIVFYLSQSISDKSRKSPVSKETFCQQNEKVPGYTVRVRGAERTNDSFVISRSKLFTVRQNLCLLFDFDGNNWFLKIICILLNELQARLNRRQHAKASRKSVLSSVFNCDFTCLQKDKEYTWEFSSTGQKEERLRIRITYIRNGQVWNWDDDHAFYEASDVPGRNMAPVLGVPPPPPPAPHMGPDGLILPRKPFNPCLTSSNHKDLRRELLFNQKVGRNVLNQKSELQRALEKQREAASRREAERNREESFKDDPRTALQRAIEQRAKHIEMASFDIEELSLKKKGVYRSMAKTWVKPKFGTVANDDGGAQQPLDDSESEVETAHRFAMKLRKLVIVPEFIPRSDLNTKYTEIAFYRNRIGIVESTPWDHCTLVTTTSS
ncbi:hypothetical protein WN51_13391 [Melipona quadrifasciata]|uniref:Uncharacterized protein n=1 Tax=Melipona quadrifasciata TaxID=166423 RepID=A0A0N0BGP0_9HYME|nr:hypothetical protein WN51_13391 [Melipona quadrifasciata]